MNQSGEQIKKCSVCKQELPTSSFTKDKYKSDGLKHMCKACSSAHGKQWKKDNPNYRVEYHVKNKDKEHARNAKYYQTVFKSRQREIYKKRYKEDVQYRLMMLLRGRLRRALLGIGKSATTLALLDCTASQLKEWLSYQFEPGMSWTNQGQWHIDHVKPCAAFDLTDPEQQRQCFHWTNLQPLWGVDNLRKNSKWEGN
jgi:hypothetical protein